MVLNRRQLPTSTVGAREELVGFAGVGEALGLGIVEQLLPLETDCNIAEQADLRNEAAIGPVTRRLLARLGRVGPFEPMALGAREGLSGTNIRFVEIVGNEPHLLNGSGVAAVDGTI